MFETALAGRVSSTHIVQGLCNRHSAECLDQGKLYRTNMCVDVECEQAFASHLRCSVEVCYFRGGRSKRALWCAGVAVHARLHLRRAAEYIIVAQPLQSKLKVQGSRQVTTAASLAALVWQVAAAVPSFLTCDRHGIHSDALIPSSVVAHHVQAAQAAQQAFF
jgi:hypothetical protein